MAYFFTEEPVAINRGGTDHDIQRGFLLHGGTAAATTPTSGSSIFDDLWLYDLTRAASSSYCPWFELTTSAGAGRYGGAMVYDFQDEKFTLIGGNADSGGGGYASTEVFDLPVSGLSSGYFTSTRSLPSLDYDFSKLTAVPGFGSGGTTGCADSIITPYTLTCWDNVDHHGEEYSTDCWVEETSTMSSRCDNTMIPFEVGECVYCPSRNLTLHLATIGVAYPRRAHVQKEPPVIHRRAEVSHSQASSRRQGACQQGLRGSEYPTEPVLPVAAPGV